MSRRRVRGTERFGQDRLRPDLLRRRGLANLPAPARLGSWCNGIRDSRPGSNPRDPPLTLGVS